MNFQFFRDHSYGYRTAFEDHMPMGYGKDVDVSAFASGFDVEKRVNDCDDELHDCTTPLYRAADGLLYKVVVSGSGSIKVWARAALLPDRAERLKEFREAKGTLKDIESASGIPFQNISKFENGGREIVNVSGKLLLRLADALGVTMEELVR